MPSARTPARMHVRVRGRCSPAASVSAARLPPFCGSISSTISDRGTRAPILGCARPGHQRAIWSGSVVASFTRAPSSGSCPGAGSPASQRRRGVAHRHEWASVAPPSRQRVEHHARTTRVQLTGRACAQRALRTARGAGIGVLGLALKFGALGIRCGQSCGTRSQVLGSLTVGILCGAADAHDSTASARLEFQPGMRFPGPARGATDARAPVRGRRSDRTQFPRARVVAGADSGGISGVTA